MNSATADVVSTLSHAPQPLNQNGRIAWPEAQSLNQIFSLPDSIIYYMAKKPSTPKCYLKMVQSCKYFFEKLPLLIIQHIHETHYCVNDSIYCFKNQHRRCKKIDINKIKTTKIWLTKTFKLSGNDISNNIPSTLHTKIFRCDKNVYLDLYPGTTTFQTFKLLAPNFHNVYIHYRSLFSEDGNLVMLESILEAIPCVRSFSFSFKYNNPAATTSTMMNILKLKNLNNLEYFSLYDIPEVIAVEDLTMFFKNHKNTRITLTFLALTEAYKIQLDQLIDTVITSSEFHKCLIFFDGQNKEKLKIMKDNLSSLLGYPVL